LSISVRLLALLALPLAVILGLLAGAVSLQESAKQAGKAVQREDNALLTSQRLLVSFDDATSAARRFAMSGNDSSAAEAEHYLRGVQSGVAALREAAKEPAQEQLVSEISKQASLTASILRSAIALAKGGPRSPALAAVNRADQSSVNASRRNLVAFAALQKRLNDQREAELTRAWARINLLMILGSILICLLSIGLHLAFGRTIAARLKRVSSNVARFAMGQAVGPPMRGSGEISELDAAVHEMMLVMNQRKEALEYSNFALTRENVERKDAESRLSHAAFHDLLTGLPNRALFMDRLRQTLARQRRNKEQVSAVCFLDLDRFKVVNDSLGHVVGDLLLIAVARRLERCLRPADTLARLGGDEFTVLVEDVADAAVGSAFAQRLLRELEAPFMIGGRELFVMSSIGVAVVRGTYGRPEDVLRDAEIAMYQAKGLGKNRYEVFAPAMLTLADAQLQLETSLRHALDRNEFRLHYQSIVSIETGELLGFEALIRWQDEERGLVSPHEFVPLAEETGAIVPIGEWVLREACRQLHEWNAAFSASPQLTMSVNVSAKQLCEPQFASRVREILAASGVDGAMLHIEITESAIMSCAADAKVALDELRAMGVRIHLDDFGTGYSSLGYLHAFPTDALKIDRSFISGQGDGVAHPEIVQSILALAHSLSIEVIAEGIETRKQYTELRLLKCGFGQGHYFSRPVDASRATLSLAASRGRVRAKETDAPQRSAALVKALR